MGLVSLSPMIYATGISLVGTKCPISSTSVRGLLGGTEWVGVSSYILKKTQFKQEMGMLIYLD